MFHEYLEKRYIFFLEGTKWAYVCLVRHMKYIIEFSSILIHPLPTYPVKDGGTCIRISHYFVFLSFSLGICHGFAFMYSLATSFSTRRLMVLMSSLWLPSLSTLNNPFCPTSCLFSSLSPLDLMFILPTQPSFCLHLPDKLCLSFYI